MKRRSAFPSRFLAKEDLQDADGGEYTKVVGTIESVNMGEVVGADDEKPIMVFKEDSLKAMVVNSTNWFACEVEWGDESDDWTGNQVEICVDPSVSFKGKRVGGLRLKAITHEVPI